MLRNCYTQHHISGTCKMGPSSDSMAVVNQYGHVHGLEGLRVIDASVMPDVIRANTNATTIMIAERVSDWIKEGKWAAVPPFRMLNGRRRGIPIHRGRAPTTQLPSFR